MTKQNPAKHFKWTYTFVYVLLFLINVLPLITEKPYHSE